MTSAQEKVTVLLLDDDKFLIDMYSMKLVQQGHIVHAFLSVNDALQSLRAGLTPDVILFDLVMPEHDGASFLKTMTQEKLAQHAVKIALTNQYDDAERRKVLELGTDQYIIKASATPSEVVNIVAQAVLRKQKT